MRPQASQTVWPVYVGHCAVYSPLRTTELGRCTQSTSPAAPSRMARLSPNEAILAKDRLSRLAQSCSVGQGPPRECWR